MNFSSGILTYQALTVTTENLDYVASWCNGAVKGIKLPAEQRCVDFYFCGNEYRACVGDTIIRLQGRNSSIVFRVIDSNEYSLLWG